MILVRQKLSLSPAKALSNGPNQPLTLIPTRNLGGGRRPPLKRDSVFFRILTHNSTQTSCTSASSYTIIKKTRFHHLKSNLSSSTGAIYIKFGGIMYFHIGNLEKICRSCARAFRARKAQKTLFEGSKKSHFFAYNFFHMNGRNLVVK